MWILGLKWLKGGLGTVGKPRTPKPSPAQAVYKNIHVSDPQGTDELFVTSIILLIVVKFYS